MDRYHQTKEAGSGVPDPASLLSELDRFGVIPASLPVIPNREVRAPPGSARRLKSVQPVPANVRHAAQDAAR